MSIVFIGTPEFAVPSLVGLADSGYEISGVITQPDRPAGRGRKPRLGPVKGAALELGLSVHQPVSLRDTGVIDEIASLRPEVMVAVAYGQILRPEFLEIAPKGVVNVHPSLLPKYRGASPIQYAILGGDAETGVTIMLMDAGMDTGPILSQARESIGDSDTGGSLSERLSVIGAKLLIETLPLWIEGSIQAQQQIDALATTTKLLKKEDGHIDWDQPAVQIWRKVRAFDPWPGTYTTFKGERLNILRAHPLEQDVSADAGEVVELAGSEGQAIAVTAAAGVVVLDEVQREGGKRMPAVEFARGAKGLVGSRLK